MTCYTIPKMDTPTTPKKKTSPAPGENKDSFVTAELRSSFLAAALSMGWQLAIVVVVPIVGGYELDQYWHKSAIWEVIGFIIAAIGFVGVLRQQLNSLNDMNKQEGHKK
jgi:hypothetical protein